MIRCDLFCRIIDNYGDIGVCWRLARQLAQDYGLTVTLWVDDLATFAQLAPSLDPGQTSQALGAITVQHWTGEIAQPDPGDLVIEGFGCPLPTGFLRAMAARQPAPVWLNLEYLSAEAWVEDCHSLASVHPATGLTQHFWFPGFTARTGGLLRETSLLAERDRFQADAAAQTAFWTRIGVPEAPAFARRLSLFAYENPALPGLLTALAEDDALSLVAAPVGRALTNIRQWAQSRGVNGPTPEPLAVGDRLMHGNLTLVALPLLPHDDYDRLLWACDLNCVRGEDSFVRGQWAGRPLLWHIYPQDEDAHWTKLNAFIAQVEQHSAMPSLWAQALRAWNHGAADPTPWAALLADLPQLTPAAQAWTQHLASQSDLATGLMRFYRSQVE